MVSVSGSIYGKFLMSIMIVSILTLGFNTIYAQPIAEEKLPDLQITDVKWYPKNPIMGEEVVIEYSLKDVAGGDAYFNRPFQVSLLIDDQKIDQHILKYYGKMDIIKRFEKTWIATEGDHSIKVVINNELQLDEEELKNYPAHMRKMVESDKDNNESKQKFSIERFRTSEPPTLVRIYTRPAIPDLQIKIDGVDYKTDKYGIITADLLKGFHDIQLQKTSVTTELDSKNFKYWEEGKLGRYNNANVTLNVDGMRYCFLTAVFDHKYKASFTTKGLPDGAKVRLTIEEPTRDKVWSDVYTVPFKFTIPEWLDTKTTLKFAVDPIVTFNNEIYKLKVWRNGILLSENPTFGMSLAPELYYAVFVKDPFTKIRVSTDSTQYVSGKDLRIKIAGIPNDLATISLVNSEGKQVMQFNKVLDSKGKYEGSIMKWNSEDMKEGTYFLKVTFSSYPLATFPSKVMYKAG